MSGEIPEGVKLALEHLIRVASQEGVMVAGFAFSGDPIFVANFGNCNDHGDIKLYVELCSLRDEKIRRGLVVNHSVKRVD